MGEPKIDLQETASFLAAWKADLARTKEEREKSLSSKPRAWVVDSPGMYAIVNAAQLLIAMDGDYDTEKAYKAGVKDGELSMEGRYTHDQAATVKSIAENAKRGGYEEGRKAGWYTMQDLSEAYDKGQAHAFEKSKHHGGTKEMQKKLTQARGDGYKAGQISMEPGNLRLRVGVPEELFSELQKMIHALMADGSVRDTVGYHWLDRMANELEKVVGGVS